MKTINQILDERASEYTESGEQWIINCIKEWLEQNRQEWHKNEDANDATDWAIDTLLEELK